MAKKSLIVLIIFIPLSARAVTVFDSLKLIEKKASSIVMDSYQYIVQNLRSLLGEQSIEGAELIQKNEQQIYANKIVRQSEMKTRLYNMKVIRESRPHPGSCEAAFFSKNIEANTCEQASTLYDLSRKKSVEIPEDTLKSLVPHLNGELNPRLAIMLRGLDVSLSGKDFEEEERFVSLLNGLSLSDGSMARNSAMVESAVNVNQMSKTARNSVHQAVLLEMLSKVKSNDEGVSFSESLLAPGLAFSGGNEYQGNDGGSLKGEHLAQWLNDGSETSVAALRESTLKKAYRALMKVENYKASLKKEALLAVKLLELQGGV